MKNTVAIIDFGSSEVVTLVGESGVNNTLNILGRGKVSYAGFHNSEFLEPELLKDIVKTSISKAETASQCKISEIYVGVPGEFTAVFPKKISLTFPSVKRLTEFDVESIFRTGNNFENETDFKLINRTVIYYELDEGQRVIDPIALKSKTLTGNVSYIFARKTFVNLISEIISKLRVNIKGFISSIYAENMFLFEPEERDRYVLMADVGYISTSVSLAQGNGLLHLYSFSLGGGYVASDLAQCLRISFSEAEKLKDKIAIAWKPSQQQRSVVWHLPTLVLAQLMVLEWQSVLLTMYHTARLAASCYHTL